MRQQKWLESLNVYELQIQYHIGRTKVVIVILRTPLWHSFTSILTTQ